MLREAGAEHGKALIVNTASIAGKGGQAWLSIYAATKAAVINFTQSTHREVGRRRDPVHGAGAGLRRHADDRVRQGPGPGRGDDPARGHRRGGPLPAAHLAQLPCARRSSSPAPARASTPPSADGRASACGSWSPPSATPATSSRRSRSAGRWPGAATRSTIETWEERRGGGRGRRARLRRGRGIPDVPAARPRLGGRRSTRPRRRGRCCRCSRRCARTSSSATSSPWRRRWPPRGPGCRWRP